MTPSPQADVAAAVAAADPAALLPARRAADHERMVRPLTLRCALELPGGHGAAVSGELPGRVPRAPPVVASLVADQAGNLFAGPLVREGGSVRRAVPGDGAAASLVRLMREPAPLPAGFDLVSLTPLGALAPEPTPDQESGIVADQTHDSVVVASGGAGDPGTATGLGLGGSVVVKWAVHVELAPGEPAAVSATRHLHGAGFTEMPEPYGFLLAREGDMSVLLASLARHLPGAQDGWDWYVSDVIDLVEGRTSLAAAVKPATVLGGLIARMHLAFARPDPSDRQFADPVSRAGAEHLTLWAVRAKQTLDEALAVTAGPAGQRLHRRADQARAVLATLQDLTPAQTPLTRIHGDLHVGQVLRWSGGYAVSDFDGNPVLPAAQRALPQPPARDVAGMLRALDHVGRIVGRRIEPQAAAPVEGWIQASGEAFVVAYQAGLAAGGGSALFDVRLLRAFEVEQECREFVYAARYLPSWAYIPDAALGPLLDRAETGGVKADRLKADPVNRGRRLLDVTEQEH